MGSEYVVECSTDTFGETLILSNTGTTLEQARRAAARWSKKNPDQIAYVVRYRKGVATGHISYARGLIDTREGDFRADFRADQPSPSPFTRTERFTGSYADSFAA